jgi:hypothetical protein
VHDAADVGHVAVDVCVRCRVARRAALPPGCRGDDVAVEVAQDHVLWREVFVRDARRLDDEQVGARYAAGDVAAGPHHEVVAHELVVQGCDLLAGAGDRYLNRRLELERVDRCCVAHVR